MGGVDRGKEGRGWRVRKGAPMNLFPPPNARGYPIIQYDAAPITESTQCYIRAGWVGEVEG